MIEQLNDILSEGGRAGLRDTAELIARLTDKRDTLKRNFVANLPLNYSNEKEFVEFLDQAEAFRKQLIQLTIERDSIQETFGQEIKRENEYEAEFGQILLKAICIKQQFAYVKCLAQIFEIKLVFTLLNQKCLIKLIYRHKTQKISYFDVFQN